MRLLALVVVINMEIQEADKTAKKQQKKVPGVPFKPGQSGNPKGRPPGSVSITAEIKARMLKVFPEKSATVKGDDGKKLIKIKKTYLQKVIEAIFENAIVEKDAKTLNQIWAYMDGQPKATLDIGADKDSLEELTEFFRAIAKAKKS